MNSRLPPLHLLRGFEAAARHLSFTRAALELHVTQAAVSHQIKLLEQHLGVPLFHRMIRQLRLTREGQTLLPVVQGMFTDLAQVVDALRPTAGGYALTIGLEPSFSANWMSPRLERFWAEHPGVDLRLHHSLQQAQFSYDDVDLAVRWGHGVWPNLLAERLMGLDFSPVCSPRLLDGVKPLQHPADLAQHTLLHDFDREGWREWLTSSTAGAVNPESGLVIDDTNVLTQAAINGQGVALCGLALVASHLQAGRLVRPFQLSVSTRNAYHVVFTAAAIQRPHVRGFVDWLHGEVAREGMSVGHA